MRCGIWWILGCIIQIPPEPKHSFFPGDKHFGCSQVSPQELPSAKWSSLNPRLLLLPRGSSHHITGQCRDTKAQTLPLLRTLREDSLSSRNWPRILLPLHSSTRLLLQSAFFTPSQGLCPQNLLNKLSACKSPLQSSFPKEPSSRLPPTLLFSLPLPSRKTNSHL